MTDSFLRTCSLISAIVWTILERIDVQINPVGISFRSLHLQRNMRWFLIHATFFNLAEQAGPNGKAYNNDNY